MKKKKIARRMVVQTPHPTTVQTPTVTPTVTPNTAAAWAGAIGQWLRLGYDVWLGLSGPPPS